MNDASAKTNGALDRFLKFVERGGNALPHPATLFLLFSLLVLVVSWIAAASGIEAVHPGKGEVIRPVNLLSVEGLHRIMGGLVTNFTNFAPLGTVLVALLGIGLAEASGLIATAMRLLVLSAPRKLLTLIVVFAGVMSNMGSEIGYVLLIPLSAMIFRAAGRHPLVGMAAAFAGVSGGYSANLLLGTVDPLLAGISQEAARLIEPEALVSASCNYYFMFVSTFLVTGVGTWVTEKIVAPRLGVWSGEGAGPEEKLESLRDDEKRGLRWALIAALAFVGLVLWGTVPADGFLRDTKGELGADSPFLKGIVALIFFSGALCGLAYGIAAGTIRSDGAAVKGMAKSMETLGSYMVLVFFAAQFVAFFNWSNLGLIFAIHGAATLKSMGLEGIPLMLLFILLTAFINLFMGSASAKWAVMAPVFIPMMMILGYPPELTQAAYRIGDSCTNIISPMMSYTALIIAFFQRYEPKAGLGTIVATMLPYTVAFLISWSVLFAFWMWMGFPFGY